MIKEIKSNLSYLLNATKVHAYYFLLILGSIFFSSGIGLVTNSSRKGSDMVGSGFMAFGIIVIALLSVFQRRFLSQEQTLVRLRFLRRYMSLKRTFVDALLFQYYLLSYVIFFGALAWWFYLKNGEPMLTQPWLGYYVVMPIFFVIAHNYVGRLTRWLFALLPITAIIVLICLMFFYQK